jgi:hypothetical protein
MHVEMHERVAHAGFAPFVRPRIRRTAPAAPSQGA